MKTALHNYGRKFEILMNQKIELLGSLKWLFFEILNVMYKNKRK